jgi:GTP-binding protein
VAIIGKPNAGKSTLLNRLVGAERAIVSEVPGTTRDAVDASVERAGVAYNFVDTAGIRRKGKTKLMAEKLSVVMARRHIRLADVVLLLIDAAEGVTALDATIAGYALESGKPVILVVNKWDLAAKTLRAEEFTRQLRDEFKFLDYAPVAFLSALTGSKTERLFPLIQRAYLAARRRISTGELNRFFAALDLDRASMPAGQRVKILYLTQASVAPPTFILFTDRPRKLHFSFERFLMNQLRRRFDFAGTPVVIRTRSRR